MSQFTPEFEFEIAFDGDTVRGKMRRMKRRHMLTIAAAIAAPAGSDGEETADTVAQMQRMEAGIPVLQECVTEFSGLSIGGEPAALEAVIDEAYFTPLVMEMLTRLLNESRIGEAEGKKSGESSGGSAEDSSAGSPSP